jgi:hypothetical protein
MSLTITFLFLLVLAFHSTTGIQIASAEQVHRVGTTDSSIPDPTRLKTHISLNKSTLTITFGPIDLPAPHAGDFAASMPKHIFELPDDIVVGGFKSSISTMSGGPLPRNYLHHLLLINIDRESLSCPGEPYIIAGTGLEMTEARFPSGYGLRLKRGTKLMAVAAFYHDVPITKGVIASLTLELRNDDGPLVPLDAYHIGVNVGCYTQLTQRAVDETDEGIALTRGVFLRSRSFKFASEGCVKLAYPHGHDYLIAIVLDNTTRGHTLLRTTPRVSSHGLLQTFADHQVYRDSTGFRINTEDTYQLTMVYHIPLHEHAIHYGMANYILYFEPGACSNSNGTNGAALHRLSFERIQ